MKHGNQFRSDFNIDQNADLSNSMVAIEAIYESNKIAFSYLINVQPKSESDGFRINSLINLLGRVYEHAQGMLVAITTGSPASSEALARIVIEGSINLMYLATIGNSSTLVMFFRSWLNEHNKKLSVWKEKIQDRDNASLISEMIEARREVVTALSQFLDITEQQCSIEEPEINYQWPPSIYKRFELLRRETDYFESYHRLSGASHITGEDTLTWLMSLNAPEELQEKLAKEAWAYSIMMTRMASIFFVDAAAGCVISYDRRDNNDLKNLRISLQQAVHEIAEDAGVPIKYTDNG